MPFLFLALFIIVPLAEIAVFIAAGDAIGLFPTIATVIVTAFLGTYLLQRQGLSAIARTQNAMAAGQLPVESIMDGVYLLIAGAFLLTPGFITDSVGFLLFVPPFRRWLGKLGFRHIMRKADIHVSTARSGAENAESDKPGYSHKDDAAGPVIDGEYEHVESDAHQAGQNKNPGTPWRRPPSKT